MELHNIPRDAGPVQKSSGIAGRQSDMQRVIHFPKYKKEDEGFRKALNEEMKKESADIEKSVDDGGIPAGQPGDIGYPASISRQWANTDFYVKGDRRWLCENPEKEGTKRCTN